METHGKNYTIAFGFFCWIERYYPLWYHTLSIQQFEDVRVVVFPPHNLVDTLNWLYTEYDLEVGEDRRLSTRVNSLLLP